MFDLFLLAISLYVVVKSSEYAIKYASDLAHAFRLRKYVVGFIVVAVISILPETFISIDSAIQGIPSFGLGTLFGSNVADLTLVVAIIIMATVSGIRVGSRILEANKWYPFFIALPFISGLDGQYSRIEGVALLLAGLLFHYTTLKGHSSDTVPLTKPKTRYRFKKLAYLLLSMAVLLLAAHMTVRFGVSFAGHLGVSPILIGLLVVGLGTTLPELIFSLQATRKKSPGLALGNILGTVISDATIAVGMLALINPFSFEQNIVFITASFMVMASILLMMFMKSGKIISKKESLLLLAFYLVFVLTEYLMSR